MEQVAAWWGLDWGHRVAKQERLVQKAVKERCPLPYPAFRHNGGWVQTHPVFESAADLRANPFGTPTGQALRKEGDGGKERNKASEN